MKNLIIVALLTLAFGCNNDKNKYSISGKLNNPQEGYIYLQELKENEFVSIDSVKPSGNGNYKLEGKLNEPGFYRVNFMDKQAVMLILESDQVILNADGNDQEGFVDIQGSPGTDHFKKINAVVGEFENKVQSINQDYAFALENSDTEKVSQLEAEYGHMQQAYYEQIMNNIRGMEGSIAAIFAASSYLNPDQHFDLMDSLAQRFEKEMPKSKYVQQFVEQINKMKVVSIGKLAPEINLEDTEGKVLNLSSFQGKYVLIDFWASWCRPCRDENPNVVRMYNRFKDKNFEILGVSLDQEKSKWLGAIEKDGLEWKHVSDLKGWQSSAADKYQVKSIPSTFLIDKAGKIIAKNLRGVELEKKLEEVLQ